MLKKIGPNVTKIMRERKKEEIVNGLKNKEYEIKYKVKYKDVMVFGKTDIRKRDTKKKDQKMIARWRCRKEERNKY